MCGIGGWIDFTTEVSKEENCIEKMMESMRRRGPDEEGLYQEEHVLLMHTRLSIMDPENGKQPMHYKKYVLVYNGELYNTKELKEELQKEGYCFFTGCDSEVLIKAYDFWQEKCLEKINGIYAFAIYDKKEKSLFMARDRLGVKPFFYHLYEKGILFSSEIKTLLKHPYVSPVIKEEGLKELFLLGPARSGGKCAFDTIKELKQGEYAIYKNANLTTIQYWKMRAKKHVESLEESIIHVHDLVCSCVESQLESDVGLCTFLSGGLDSSIITKIASKHYKNLSTYSVEYEENERYFQKSEFQPNRDQDYIDIMVKDCNTQHNEVVLSQIDCVKALKEALIARDLPGMAEVDSSLLLFCKEIKENYSVAVSGEGADEIFGGYPWYSKEEVLYKENFPWSTYDIRLFCLKENILQKGEEYIQNAYQKTLEEVEYLEEDSKKERRMREMFYLNIRWFLTTLLDRKDRMSMYHGLEVRVPFLDYRLVEYAYNLPWEYKSMQGREKGILREAFKEELPKVIVERKKSPYPKSHHPLYTKLLIEELKDILKQDCILSFILDIHKVEELIEHIDEVKTPWYGQLMKGPQILAYFIQMHYFFEEYKVILEI